MDSIRAKQKKLHPRLLRKGREMINTQAHDDRMDLLGEPLSKCQLQLLQYFVATGNRDKEIAYHFSLSIQTIKNQLQFIRHKTGCRNRSELMIWYASNSKE